MKICKTDERQQSFDVLKAVCAFRAAAINEAKMRRKGMRENKFIKQYRGKINCCGCEACFAVCPVNAIEMKEDEEGFRYPQEADGHCIHCGLCLKICAFQEALREKGNQRIDYGSY